MIGQGRNFILTLSVIIALTIMAGSPLFLVEAAELPCDLNVGPYLEKVVFKILDNNILALQSGVIDVTLQGGGNPELWDADPDISYQKLLRNGFGTININCGKYPLNISALRRAFAFAFDKTRITEIWDGFSQEHDSLVPYGNPWCIEDSLPYHYYTAQVEMGNQLLDEANFTIDSVSGYRLAPDGTEFNIKFEYFVLDALLAISQVAMDAFESLHINAYSQPSEWYDLWNRVDHHLDYDMAIWASNFGSYDTDYLAYNFWSENADAPYQNPWNFQNDTFDSWREQFLHSTSYEEVYEACAAMQLILHENVPQIITYQSIYIHPYRTDKFTGFVPDVCRYMGSQWTFRKAHKIDGSLGGTLCVSTEGPDSLNIFLGDDLWSTEISLNLWPSLFIVAPDGTQWPYIAESFKIETHTDNSKVPDGHTRFTIDIIQNATWTDGTPLTAADVAFTFTYLLETQPYGNPASVKLSDLIASYAPTTYRVVLEYGTESWWHIPSFAYVKIIPQHIFNDDTGIGYEGWNTWNPVFDPSHPFVTSGPFTLTDHVRGEFYEITANPDFAYYPQSLTTNGTQTTNGDTPPSPFNLTLSITGGVIGVTSVVLVGRVILFKREK